MNADSLSLESWDEFASERQLDSWQMPDSLAKLDAMENDFTLGLPVSSPLNSFTWKPDPSSLLSSTEDSDPFKRFQTPLPHRYSPTPLDDLYTQSMDQAEVSSSDWKAPVELSQLFEKQPVQPEAPVIEQSVQQPTNQEKSNQEFPEQKSDMNQLRTDFTPADFDISRFVPENDSDSNYLNSNVNIQDVSEISNSDEQFTSSIPQLEQNSQIANTETKQTLTRKTPVLFYLGIAISICGIGLVFGAQMLSKATLINPGKALIIAGVSGIMFSGISCFLGSLFHRAKA